MERREGKLTSIAEILDRNIVLNGADVLSAKGFTQVPNHVLVSGKLSPGAKLTYAMLLKYAWQNDFCFPGQERLAKDMGVTDRSVRTYLQDWKCRSSSTSSSAGWASQTFTNSTFRLPPLTGKICRSESEESSASRPEKFSYK
jgi:Helix-turn-helix domain